MTKNTYGSHKIGKAEAKRRKSWGGVAAPKTKMVKGVTLRTYEYDMDWDDPAIKKIEALTRTWNSQYMEPAAMELDNLTPQARYTLNEWQEKWKQQWGSGYGMNPADITKSTAQEVMKVQRELDSVRAQMNSMAWNFDERLKEMEKAFELRMADAKEELRKEREKAIKLERDNAALHDAFRTLSTTSTGAMSGSAYYLTPKGLASLAGVSTAATS